MTTIKSFVAVLLAFLAGAGVAGAAFATAASVQTTSANAVLTVTKPGSGEGTVVSDVGAIDCGATCSDSYPTSTIITLTATPAAGSQFIGWLGPCGGTGSCQFTINGPTTVVATFAPTLLGAPTIDVDGNASYDPLTDGLLILRYLFGMSGIPLIAGAVDIGATRTTAAEIEAYLVDIKPVLDIDGDGNADALTDGLLIIRYLSGLRGDSLVTGAVGPGAPRTTAAAIESVLAVVSPAEAGLPPDPATVASPIDVGVATSVGRDTTFLYTGANPVQTGVAPGTINPTRAAVLRGKVIRRSGSALPGVTISILDHPEFGQTLSRADGMFDLVVNGGGPLTVSYAKSGWLPAHRQLDARWQDFALAPDVALILLDPQATVIDLSLATPIQVARGSVVTDSDGTRRATLLFPAGTTASMALPGGGSAPLIQLTVRATEYTVGTNGPKAMPGALPPTSSYTYAVEYSVDEALSAGATGVSFSQPVISYLENFLAFPVGTAVPTGLYDRQKAQWIAAPDGRVVKILSITAGSADLDIDGSGIAANGAALAALGISAAERQSLGALYAGGQALWRVPIPHFSTPDLNWGAGPPPGASPPNQPSPDNPLSPNPCNASGSIIECENQVLGQRIPIVATPYTLNYRSSRVPGFKAANSVHIQLSGAVLPPNVQSIDLEVLVAGQRFSQSFPPLPNQATTFVWDGQDAYGRVLQGPRVATIRLSYQYQGVYTLAGGYAAAFAQYGSNFSSNDTRTVLSLSQVLSASVGVWNSNAAGLGGWSLSVHHSYDPGGRNLYRGDGRQGNADAKRIDNVIATLAGTGAGGCNGDGGPAALATLFNPVGVAAGADGSVYIADVNDHVIRRVAPSGIIKTFAGIPFNGCIGEGGPANQIALNTPESIAIGPDGSLYISDLNDNRVRRVAPGGTVTVVAGTGSLGFSGDGGPATAATIRPRGIAVGADGALYIAHPDVNRVRKVGTDGIIQTVAGTGVGGFSGDGGPALQAKLADPRYLAVGPDGSLYIADRDNNRVRRVTPDGIIRTVAGTGQSGSSGDGGPATQATLTLPDGIAIGPDGSLYIAHSNRIRRVGPDGIISTVAGSGTAGFAGDKGPAAQAQLQVPHGLASGPDGSLYIGDSNNNRVRRVASPLPGFSLTDILVPSEDGDEVYRFDALGRHLTTQDALTGAALYTFGYDGAGRLITITDVSNNVTTIERSAGGDATGIVGPYGQHTTLAHDANGYLSSITDPAGQATILVSTADGLLTSLTDPRNATHAFNYDSLGRLQLDQDPAGGSTSLNRVDGSQTYTVTRTTALARTTTYKTDRQSDGSELRTLTEASGLASMQLRSVNGSVTANVADGTTTQEVFGPDPRWGLLAPITRTATEQTPGGRLMTMTTVRTATLTDPNNPLTLSAQTDTFAVNGKAYTSAYDGSNRKRTETTPVGRSRTLTIDAQGRPVQTQLASLEAINRTYDSHGRLATIVTGSGVDMRTTTFAYNSDGYLDTVTDPLGRTESYLYDLAGRVTRQTLPDGRSVQFTYDANGNRATLTPPGKPAHDFAYTSVDLTSTYTPPNVGAGTNQTLYAYNFDRQPTLESRPDSQTLAYGYDAAGRRNALTIARGAFSYGYHPTTGNLATVAAPGGIGLSYAFDGPLLTSTAWTGPITGTVALTYDNDLRVSALAVNGSSLALTYDNDSLLTQAGALVLSNDPQNGLLTGTTLGSATDAWTYNGFGESLTYHAVYNAAPVFDQQYTRDKLGRITQKIETIGGITDTYGYSYDLAGRLIGVTKNGTAAGTYVYDTNGNRLSVTNTGGTTSGTYDNQDRLTQYGTASYAYGANGELQSRTVGAQTTSYQYDALGNLMAVTLANGTPIAYLVDGQNRRIGKKVNGTLTQGFLYKDDLKPIAELDGSSAVVSRFVYATRDNVPDYMIKGGVTYRIFTDHLGSPRLVVDVATGTVAQRIDYDEFGRVVSDTSPGLQPFGFAGGLYDKDTGLVRFGARDYDPATGRWTAKDPAGFGGRDANLYVYAASDPVNRIDPTGLEGEVCDLRCQDFARKVLDRTVKKTGEKVLKDLLSGKLGRIPKGGSAMKERGNLEKISEGGAQDAASLKNQITKDFTSAGCSNY